MVGRLPDIPALQFNYLPLLFHSPITVSRCYRRPRKKKTLKRGGWHQNLNLGEGEDENRSRRYRVGLLGRQSRPWN